MDEQPATTRTATILIVESAELMRRGLRDVIGADPGFRAVGEVARVHQAPRAALQLSPDVVFLGLGRDVRARSEPPGLAAIRQLMRVQPFARVLAMVEDVDVGLLMNAVRAGARGVLLRDAPVHALVDAARDVLAGGAAIDPRLARGLFEYLTYTGVPASSSVERAIDPAMLRLLSPREQEVLQALAHGCRNKEIAAKLGVSVGTVKTHLRHIFRKLEVADRTGAVLAVLQVRSDAEGRQAA